MDKELIAMNFEEKLCYTMNKFEDVIIYGYKDIGSCVFDYINNLELGEKVDNYIEKIKSFAHTGVQVSERQKNGISIKSILDLEEYKDSALVIVATQEQHHDAIRKTLEELGFKHILYIMRSDYAYMQEIVKKVNSIKFSIERSLSLGNKEFVIYPFGENGKLTKRILNEAFGIQEKYVVDNILCGTDSNIKSVEYLKEDYKKEEFVVLLSIFYNPPKTNDVYKQIGNFISIERLVDVLSPSTYFNPKAHNGPVEISADIRYKTIECISREIYINGIEGAVAEAGVYRGATARRINQLFPDRKLYLFDTFEGFDERDQKKDDEANRFNEKLDFTNTSVEFVIDQMCYPENCIVKKGWFPESAAGIEDKFAFVRLDMDLYEPIYAGLKFFYPRMVNGGYIAVHDCRSNYFDGARDALIDFCKENHLNYMCMPDTLGTAVICIGF